MSVAFKIVTHGSDAWKEAVRLREDILRKPLSSTFTNEELDEERMHIQVVGFLQDKIIATAVLVPEENALKIQRVVVESNLRNQNTGSTMMAYCESYAKGKGYHSMYCHARDSAVSFYLKNGYRPEGDYFEEDGIPHLKMRKEL